MLDYLDGKPPYSPAFDVVAHARFTVDDVAVEAARFYTNGQIAWKLYHRGYEFAGLAGLGKAMAQEIEGPATTWLPKCAPAPAPRPTLQAPPAPVPDDDA